MTRRTRPSLLYMAPGHDFLPSAGPTRNMLGLARAMSGWADITLAFRQVASRPGPDHPPVLEIAPASPDAPPPAGDVGTTGMGYVEFVRYLRSIQRFCAERAGVVDVVLEKDWMLTGFAAREWRKRGLAAIPVKNWLGGYRAGPRNRGTRRRRGVAATIEGMFLRRAPCIVAETDVLKAGMVARWGLDPSRIQVIGMGVDRDLFRPGDPAEARARLGIHADAMVLLYVGILDQTHDLAPLLRALVRVENPSLQLHVLGDGPRRAEYGDLASGRPGAVFFHGRVPHTEVPAYVTAADLCAAPYDPAMFSGGTVGYSTLKVREYMSAGRPVATVGSGTLTRLVQDGVTGFLLDNDVDSWDRLLRRRLPSADLRRMGAAAAAADLKSWSEIGRMFQQLCLDQMPSTLRDAEPVGSRAPARGPDDQRSSTARTADHVVP